MIKKILTASGFLMPESNLFELYDDKSSQFEDFVGRDNQYALKTLTKYYSDNKISVSMQADSLYQRYKNENSYTNFIAMVDFMADVFSRVDCAVFMEWQAYNRHISPVTLMLCRDLVIGNFDHFHKYDNITAMSRFVMNEAITKDEGARRHKAIVSGLRNCDISWLKVLEPLMGNKANFVTVFKYFFVNSQ